MSSTFSQFMIFTIIPIELLYSKNLHVFHKEANIIREGCHVISFRKIVELLKAPNTALLFCKSLSMQIMELFEQQQTC